MMDISVMICTWNNCRRLELTLAALGRCIVPADLDVQFVVVNNNCTDGTNDIVLRASQTMPVELVAEPQPGLSHARNRGLAACNGRFIIFMDDDVTPCREWLQEYAAAFEEYPEGYFFGGRVISEFETNAYDQDLLKYAPFSVRGVDWGSQPVTFPPGELRFAAFNWACPAAAVRAAGGFNPELGLNSERQHLRVGEETHLMHLLECAGLRARYLPGARLTHFVPERKVTTDHLAARARAVGHYRQSRRNDPQSRGPAILGVPLRLLASFAVTALRWVYAACTGRSRVREELRWRGLLGRLDATLESRHRQDETLRSV